MTCILQKTLFVISIVTNLQKNNYDATLLFNTMIDTQNVMRMMQ